MIGWLVSWLVGWLVGWLVNGLVDQLVDWWISGLVGLVDWRTESWFFYFHRKMCGLFCFLHEGSTNWRADQLTYEQTVQSILIEMGWHVWKRITEVLLARRAHFVWFYILAFKGCSWRPIPAHPWCAGCHWDGIVELTSSRAFYWYAELCKM